MANARPARTAPLVGSALLCAGCFAYVPAELASVPPGDEVRVELTRVGFARLPEIPNNSGPDLSGVLVGNGGDRLLLRVPVAIRRDGLLTNTVEQEVAIPTADIVRVERREFSRRRTAVAAAGALASLAGLWAAFGDEGPPSGEQPDEPEDGEAGGLALIAALLRFSIPLP